MPREEDRAQRLETDFLPERTRALFERLKDEPLLKGFTLIGGSALALQIGHRISEDLDFNLFGGELPVDRLRALLSTLAREGRQVLSLVTENEKSAFHINHGFRMDRLVQDYAVDGAKLTFCSRKAPQRPQEQIDYLLAAQKLLPTNEGSGFDVLETGALFVMKSLVLNDRARSRDVFDLMVLVRDHGYSLSDLFGAIDRYGHVDERDPERYKSVLTGLIPLDPKDEGFEGIGLSVSMEEIYGFFQERVDEYETSLAFEVSRRQKPGLDQNR